MRNVFPKLLVLSVFAATAALAASAQDVVVTKQVTEKALAERYQVEAAMAAIESCSANNIQASVVIVDNFGNVRLTMLADGAKPTSLEAARRKAYTSALMRRSTEELVKALAENPHMRVSPDPEFMLMAGGIPLKKGNDVIGALGVSGGKPEQDAACAQAGFDKIKAVLQ